MIAAIGEREISLRLGADSADDMGAERPRPLARQKPDAAGGGVDQHPMVRLDLEGLVQQVPDRHSLQHQHRALLVSDMVGQFYELVRRNIPLRGIAAEIEIIGDAIAGMKIGHPRANRQDLAGRLIAGDEGQSRRLVKAVAVIHIDKIQADGMLADADLAGTRRGHIHRLIDQGFRAPYLVHAHGLGHVGISLGVSLIAKRKPSRSRCQHDDRERISVALGREIVNQHPRAC